MEQGIWVKYHPITTVTDGSPVEFDIGDIGHRSTGDDYIDFANTMRFVKVKVVRLNGNNIAADAVVGFVNLFLHSLVAELAGVLPLPRPPMAVGPPAVSGVRLSPTESCIRWRKSRRYRRYT